MKEYLSFCVKFIKALVKIKIIDLKIKYYELNIDHTGDKIWKQIYAGRICDYRNDRDDLVKMADNLIYTMEEKGWIK